MIAQIIAALIAAWIALIRLLASALVQLVGCCISAAQTRRAARRIAAAQAEQARIAAAQAEQARIAAAQTAPDQTDTQTAREIASLQNRIDAELTLADAAAAKADAERDPYKRAQWRKREQDANARADRLQDKIDRLTL